MEVVRYTKTNLIRHMMEGTLIQKASDDPSVILMNRRGRW